MKQIIFFTVCFIALPLVVFGASSDFRIRHFIGVDVTPPAVPTLLSVVPVAPTQIDITWGVSTDDYELLGYVLRRDGVPIATTTLTSFSDTGLTPETEYSYTVEAYDWVFNFSASSTPLSTTTLALPPPATTTPPSTGAESITQATRVIMLRDFSILTNDTTATIAWSTNFPARYELRWGRTVSYELGFSVSDTYRKEQRTVVTDLEPGTTYEYELIGYSPNGIPQVLSRGQFLTEDSGVVATLPANVKRLTAEVIGASVQLRWENPDSTDIAYVRVLRNHRQYPAHQNDGILVYQGRGEQAFDLNALALHSPQYYSVFVVDEQGSVSSGAIVRAFTGGQIDTSEDARNDTDTSELVTPDAALPAVTWFPPEAIEVSQGTIRFTFGDTDTVLSPSLPFTISIPYAVAPPRLKSIIVTLLDPTNQKQSYAFLLRLNKEKTAYEATVAPLEVAGASRFLVEVFDYETGLVGRYAKHVDFSSSAPGEPAVVVFPDALIAHEGRAWVLILGLLCFGVLWLWLLLKRRKRREEKE